VVDPTTAAVQMASHMHEMVKQIRAGVPPATQHLETPELVEWANRFFRESNVKDVFVILNRIRDGAMERLVRGKLAEKAIEPIAVVYEDPAIAMAWLQGTRLAASQDQVNLDQIVDRLEAVADAKMVPA